LIRIKRYNRAVNPIFRAAAALLLAMMLPIQGWAAACAQICALAQQPRHSEEAAAQHGSHDADPAAMESDAPVDSHADHCGKSEIGAGKCCQAHVYLAEPAVTLRAVSIPSFDRDPFVSSWTSFVPEELNPPPIAAAPIA
jgi:hypothetical protein